MDWEKILTDLVGWCMNEGIKIVISFILLVVSFIIINRFTRVLVKRLDKRGADKTMSHILVRCLKVALKVLVVLSLFGYLGLETGSITALVGALGVGVGLAVQGALSNFAGGMLLLITRPFKVDDYISFGDIGGTVEEINIIYTHLRTPDNKSITVPNGTLANSNVTNYSVKETRRVDFTFSIAYTADFKKAQSIVLGVFESHALVLKDPAPSVRMNEQAASSINLASRCWVKSGDYWTVYFDVMESVKAEFDKNGIEIPFTQMDIHIGQLNK